MRDLRGDMSQAEFARKIGKSQQIVSRLENPNYHGWTVATLFDVASKLGIAAFVRFVDFPTFLKYTDDMSESAMRPPSYSQSEVDAMLAQDAESDAPGGAMRAFLSERSRQQPPAAANAANLPRTGVQREVPPGEDQQKPLLPELMDLTDAAA
jgi:transcriptional regulator with XRE-family HTH domain